MKGEGVEPGNVVYTAALAECRWAGQAKHVEYLLQRMEAEGMSIVPGMGTHILGLEAAYVYVFRFIVCANTPLRADGKDAGRLRDEASRQSAVQKHSEPNHGFFGTLPMRGDTGFLKYFERLLILA